MATVNGTGQWIKKGVHKTTWANLTTVNDNGSAQKLPDLADKSIQVLGTLGAAGDLLIQGSNDGGTTWHTLNDPQGNPLSFTALKTEQTLENPELIRPFITAGEAGVTDLTCIMVSHGAS